LSQEGPPGADESDAPPGTEPEETAPKPAEAGEQEGKVFLKLT